MSKRDTILALFISSIALLVAIARPISPSAEAAPRTITVTVIGEYTHIADSVYFDVDFHRQEILPEDLASILNEWHEYVEIINDDRVDVYHRNLSIYNPGNHDGLVDPLNPGVSTRVALYDLSYFTPLLEHFTRVEATSVRWLTFFVNDDDTMRLEAENDALEKARDNAERIAQLEGYELGDIISLDILSPGAYQPYPPEYPVTEGLADIEGLPLNPPPVQISVSATVTFELR